MGKLSSVAASFGSGRSRTDALALRHCSGSPTCPNLSGRCDTHTRPTQFGWNVAHDNSATRIRGRQLQTLRRELFAREPLCRLCTVSGRTTLATIRDHIVPLAEGGTDDMSNIQPLCAACSDAKTQAEAQRGKRVHRW
jgi:5-methylcytosine-specific restriction protein A